MIIQAARITPRQFMLTVILKEHAYTILVCDGTCSGILTRV